MKPSQLQALIAIAQGEGMAGAAERLNISVPAVTKTISSLENDLGIELLDRSGYRVALNEYGSRLVEHGKVIVSEIDEAKRDLSLMKSINENLVRLNASPAILPTLLPETIHRLREKIPNASISFEGHLVGYAQQKLDDLLAGKYDVLVNVVEESNDLSNFRYQQLANMQLKLFSSPQHEAASLTNPTLAQLRDYTWLIPAAREGLPYKVMQRMFADSGTHLPDQLISLPTREVAFELMKKGNYLVIAPYHNKMIEHELSTSAKTIQCDQIHHGWPLYVLQRKTSIETIAIKTFIELLKETVNG